MIKFKKLAGFAFITGAVLNVTRMIPVMVGRDNIPPQFPLNNAEDISFFVSGNYTGHFISHLMALAAFSLIILGLFYLYRLALKKSQELTPHVFITFGMFGFGLFTIAVIIDGFIMPWTVENYLSSPSEISAILVEFSHKSALRFYAPANLLIFICIGFVSLSLFKMEKFPRMWCFAGMLLCDLALIGYIFGWFGYEWEFIPWSGIIFLFAHLWWISLGALLLNVKLGNNS